jgi:hypothetical protein
MHRRLNWRSKFLDGRKIDTIKTYREVRGMGLKESDETVEALVAEIRAEYPDKFPEKSGGCAGIFLLGLGVPG